MPANPYSFGGSGAFIRSGAGPNRNDRRTNGGVVQHGTNMNLDIPGLTGNSGVSVQLPQSVTDRAAALTPSQAAFARTEGQIQDFGASVAPQQQNADPSQGGPGGAGGRDAEMAIDNPNMQYGQRIFANVGEAEERGLDGGLGPQSGNPSGIVFDDGRTYEEVIAEPYTADQQQGGESEASGVTGTDGKPIEMPRAGLTSNFDDIGGDLGKALAGVQDNIVEGKEFTTGSIVGQEGGLSRDKVQTAQEFLEGYKATRIKPITQSTAQATDIAPTTPVAPTTPAALPENPDLGSGVTEDPIISGADTGESLRVGRRGTAFGPNSTIVNPFEGLGGTGGGAATVMGRSRR